MMADDMIDSNKSPPDCRVTLTTRNESTFTGFLHSIEETSGKIVLTSVTTAGSKLYGPQNFYMSDLINLQILTDDTRSQKKPATDKRECSGVKTFTSMNMEQHHLQSLENINSDDLAIENKFAVDGRDEGLGSGEDGPVADNNDYYEEDGYIFISNFCDKFYEAIIYIMKQNVVGVTFKGVNIGRDGTLSLIQISTDIGVFIFDILRLGKQAFDEGLQALFEASSIVKVIHDCRWMSDMLLEKYKICLANIFDTQVANAFVYKNLHNGDWPQYVESLPCCLVKHLTLPAGDVHFKKEESSVWLQRPLSANFLSAESKNVGYLIPLYQVLINKLLSEFRMGVEIYLNHVKMLNGQTAELCRMNGHNLPRTFLEIPKLVVNNTFTNSREGHSHKNDLNISDQKIIFSHDSVERRSKGPRKYGTDKPAWKGRPADRNGYKQDNNNFKNRRVDTKDSNIKVSQSSNFKFNKKEILDDLPHLKDEMCSVNHPAHNSCSQIRETNSSSKIVANSHHEYRKEENIQENKSNSYFPVPTYTDKSVYASCTVELEWINHSSKNLLTTCTPPRVEKKAENVLETEINNVPKPASESSSSICRSKLWQAVHAKQIHTSPQVTCELNASEENSNQQELRASSLDEHVVRKNICDEIKVSESFQKLADHRFFNPQKSPIKNSSFENYESDTSPVTHQLLDSSSSSDNSFTHNCLNSGTVGSLAPTVAELDSKSFLPAGCMEVKVSKRKIRDFLNKTKSRDNTECNETTYLPTLALEDDLGCIPMQASLTRLQELPLGATFGIGDLFSKSEHSIQQSKSPQSFIESHSTFNDDTAVEDTEIENTRESKILQKALKMTSSSSSGNLRHKLLPPKTPPGCGSNYSKY